MKRHKYKFRKELAKKTESVERRHLALVFFKAQQVSAPLTTISARLLFSYYNARSRIILYCLVTGRIRSSLSLLNTSRHVFFWSVDHSYNTGFVMAS
jgi:hypothetical protein